MLEKYQSIIELYKSHNLEGIDMVNELMRFQALDQLVSSNAHAREWGLTSEALYKLAERSTSEAFGPIPYDEETMTKIYGPSFAINLIDFITDTDYLEGIDAGHQWETPIRESIEAHKDTDHLVLFAYVEEYACMIEEILQSFEPKKVVLYTASPVCYSVLSRLYPMAQIINRWPHASYFDHIVTASVGMFKPCEDIVEEVANGLNNLVQYGTARLFVPSTMAQAQVGLNKMALQFFLTQKRIEKICEWAPLGAYEIIYGPANVKKMNIGVREFDGNEWKETAFIKLPHGVFGDMTVFTVLNYALSLRSILLPGGQMDPTLGQDGIYSLDSRVPVTTRTSFAAEGAYMVAFKQDGEDVEVVLTTQAPDQGVYWMFPDQELAYLWYTYFTSTIGKTIMAHITHIARTEEGFGYFLGNCRRSVLNVNDEAALIESVTKGQVAYAESITKAQESWQHTIDTVATKVVPLVESIDLEAYTDNN